jgi:hypothetical protein
MEYHGVKIIDIEPPMRDDPPPSDYLIAQRLARIQEKLHILDDSGYKTWQTETVRKQLNRQANQLLKEHDAHQAAFDEWIRQGKPVLKPKEKTDGQT